MFFIHSSVTSTYISALTNNGFSKFGCVDFLGNDWSIEVSPAQNGARLLSYILLASAVKPGLSTSISPVPPQNISVLTATALSGSIGFSFSSKYVPPFQSSEEKYVFSHLIRSLSQLAALQEQINELPPTEKVMDTSDVPDYNERITLLRYALERYANFDSDEDIPEAVVEAFVEKIVVNQDSFDWYLHFTGDDKTPKTCNVEGDKKAHKIELFEASLAPALVEGCSGCYRR